MTEREAGLYSYSAYGLTIQSELPLPALRPGHGSADVTIRRGALADVRRSMQEQRQEYRLSPHEGFLIWEEIATYAVREGREIIVDAMDSADTRSVNLGILSPVLAMLLQQRGYLLLHASAVALENRAIAFVGPPRHGKSTTAAVFHQKGNPLVVDDIVAVRFDGSKPVIYPAIPQFKLWPDSLNALGHDPDSFQEIEPAYVKRAKPVRHGFWERDAIPLERVYLLAWGNDLSIDAVSLREAFLQISFNSYAIQWMHEISGSRFLNARAKLVQSVPIRRLVRPRDFGRLDELVAMVRDDVAGTGEAAARGA